VADSLVLPLASRDPASVGPYRLAGRLGAGGMGVVYLSWRGDTPVAVKVMRDELAGDPQFRARFAREVEVLRRIDGVCTVHVLDAAADADQPYLVTEYVDGPSLASYVNEHGPLDGPSLRALAAGLAEALQAIHSAGVVHRDLKPANVLLTVGGPKVIDFGIAQVADATSLTATSSTLGSPGYIAPEQIRGLANTAAADVFTWAATVAFAATGRAPFGVGASDAVLFRVLHDDADLALPSRGDVPDPRDVALLDLLSASLAKDPAARPSVTHLLAELLPPDLTRRLPAEDATAVLLQHDWHVVGRRTMVLPRPQDFRTAVGAIAAPAAVPAPNRRRWLPYAAAVVGGVVAGGLSLLAVPADELSAVGRVENSSAEGTLAVSGPPPRASASATPAPRVTTTAAVAAPPPRQVTRAPEAAPWSQTVSNPDGRIAAAVLDHWRGAGGFDGCDLYAPIDFGLDEDVSTSFGGSSGVPVFSAVYEAASVVILPPETQPDYSGSYESEPKAVLADGTEIFPAVEGSGYNDLLLTIPGQQCWVLIAADDHVTWDNLFGSLRRIAT
jgi:predicted Ser/Thr protein kinase